MRSARSGRLLRAAGVAVGAMLILAGCTARDDHSPRLPPPLGSLSYQLGGSYPPPDETDIVVRDRVDSPSPEANYNVCYVNLLQTQPDGSTPDATAYGTTAWWLANHPDLLLRDDAGALVIDRDWDEALFDVSTAQNRDALFAIQREWITECAQNGFDAIEPDNLDANTRSGGLLSHQQIRDYLTRIVQHAHHEGLAIAQKNAIDDGDGFGDKGGTFINGTEGFDFAIVEQCGYFDECAAYAAVYGERVYDIEYDREGFKRACASYGSTVSVQLRDLDLTVPGDTAHIEERC